MLSSWLWQPPAAMPDTGRVGDLDEIRARRENRRARSIVLPSRVTEAELLAAIRAELDAELAALLDDLPPEP